MNYILFDDKSWDNLLPLTFTRPVCEVRTGILTIKEKWEKILDVKLSYLTQEYLQAKYLLNVDDDNILINGSVIPNAEVLNRIKSLKHNEALVNDQKIIAVRLEKKDVSTFNYTKLSAYQTKNYELEFITITWPWDIFKFNGENIISDFELLTKDRKSAKISTTNKLLGEENIFVEEGAKIEFAILNASTGPIYIGKNTEIMENSVIRGPFALCDHGVIKMAAKIYGPTTIGPYSKVGGEINNSVLFGFSNKAHDGFLGNSVIGEWCNLGADTNNSNLKNNYAEVRLWNYESQRFIKTGLQFCGLIMGDHSKCAINTMFNTGTVVGVNANIFGEGFPRNFIPSFSWGGAHGFTIYDIRKAYEVAEIVMQRRNLVLDNIEKNILKEVFERTSKYRMF
ncbi:MAG: glucose-1-phosphate thymidylyltransferase [Marinilabiliales bacterium]|nr:MAG: glucose-1-phosphate thymidylyltransferase [Marinilabiliales bacterium]